MLKSILGKKWIWISLGIALLAVVIAGVVIAMNLESIIKNNKDTIIAKIESEIGRDVTIGDLNVSIWSGLGVGLTDFQVSDDPAFGQEPFVQAKNLFVSLKFWPLLQRKIEVSRFTLDEPQIRVIQNKDGAFNFFSLIKPKETKPSTSEQSMSLTLAQLNINKGTVVYAAAGKPEIQVEQIELAVRDFAQDQSFPVDFSAAVMDDHPNISFQGTVGPLAGTEGIPKIDGSVKLSPVSLKTLQAVPAIASSIPTDVKLDGTVQGTVDLNAAAESVNAEGNFDLSQASIVYGELFQKPKGHKSQIGFQAKYTPESVVLDAFSLAVDPIVIQGKGQAGLGKTLTYKINAEADDIDLNDVEKLVSMLGGYKPGGKVSLRATASSGKKGPDVEGILRLSDVKAEIAQLPKPVSNINGTIAFTGNQAKTKDLKVRLGESEITLEAQTQSLAPLAFDYKFQSPEIGVQDVLFLAPTGDKPDELMNASGNGHVLLDAKGLSSKGQLRSESGAFYGLDFKNFKGDYQLKDLVATIPALTVQTLDGLVKGNLVYDMSQTPPTFDLATELQAIDVLEYFRSSLSSLPDFMEGRLNMNLNLQGSGKEWKAIQPTLNGKGNLEIIDGVLLNMNLGESVLGGLTRIPGASNFLGGDLKTQYPALFANQHTVFDNMKLSADIQNGKIDFGTMLIQATDWAVNGDGVYDFAKGLQSNGVLQLSQGLSNYLTGKASFLKYLTDSRGQVVVPFSMNGMLPSITPSPNSDLVANLLKKAVAGKVLENMTGSDSSSPFSNILKNSPLGGMLPGAAQTTPAKPETKSATPETTAETPESATKTTSPENVGRNLFKGLLDAIKK